MPGRAKLNLLQTLFESAGCWHSSDLICFLCKRGETLAWFPSRSWDAALPLWSLSDTHSVIALREGVFAQGLKSCPRLSYQAFSMKCRLQANSHWWGEERGAHSPFSHSLLHVWAPWAAQPFNHKMAGNGHQATRHQKPRPVKIQLKQIESRAKESVIIYQLTTISLGKVSGISALRTGCSLHWVIDSPWLKGTTIWLSQAYPSPSLPPNQYRHITFGRAMWNLRNCHSVSAIWSHCWHLQAQSWAK